MINKKQNNSIITILVALSIMAQSSFARSVVITSKSTDVNSLSAKEVKSLFLKKKKTLANGVKVVVGDQDGGSDIRKQFSKKVLGKSIKKLKSYWTKRVFSGKGKPPKVIGDDNAMKKWVATTPNSLGYIDEKSVDDSIKVIF